MREDALEPGVERSWRDLAVAYRRALVALSWPVPYCLPGERDACGQTDAEHAAAYLGTMGAVLSFRADHLHMGERGEQIRMAAFRAACAELEVLPPCGRVDEAPRG